MRTGWWWLRLESWTWINAWRARPVRGTLLLSLWLLPVVVLPVALDIGGEGRAAAALDWVLSLDVPLALGLAAQVGSAVVALASRADTESWIAPVNRRGAAGRALFVLRLLHAARWSSGLALAVLLLSIDGGDSAAQVRELLSIDGFALLGGATFAWVLLSGRHVAPRKPVGGTATGSGLSALSWVPLREAGRVLNQRRLAMLAIPVLLAAPMGSDAQQILRALVAWTVGLYVFNWMRQAGHATGTLHRWMPGMRVQPIRLKWYVWRYVLFASLAGAAALWLGWRVTAPLPPVSSP
jgi:hypothetical protein